MIGKISQSFFDISRAFEESGRILETMRDQSIS